MRSRDQLSRIQVTPGALQADPGVGFADMGSRGVGAGVDRHGPDAQASAGGEYPAGDLTAVGDQNSVVITGTSPRSHPEDAEVRRPLDRAVGDGGQAHSQYGPGVAWIDHAVVVQHAGQHHRQ